MSKNIEDIKKEAIGHYCLCLRGAIHNLEGALEFRDDLIQERRIELIRYLECSDHFLNNYKKLKGNIYSMIVYEWKKAIQVEVEIARNLLQNTPKQFKIVL